MRVRRLVVAVVSALVVALVTPGLASAALDTFLKVAGIPGDSKDPQHRGEIDVLAWSWGLANSGHAGGGGGGGGGKANFQDFSFTKFTDRASPLLLEHIASGQLVPSAVLTVRKAGAQPTDYLKICFSDVLFDSLSTGGSGGEDRLTENVAFSFDAVQYGFTPTNDQGLPGPPIWRGWDIIRNMRFNNPCTTS
jgi:type VI secretion system secreted protein Hcp